MPTQPTKAFTFNYNQLVNVIKTPVKIKENFDPSTPLIDLSGKTDLRIPYLDINQFMAIWDTGATGTFISQRVVDHLNLTVTGFKYVQGALGQPERMPTYDVSIYLPEGICITDLEVTLADLGNEDVLIGMDIILGGDFTVTNKKRNTIFSFRFPSMGHIDFVKEMIKSKPKTPGQKRKRNKPKRKKRRNPPKKNRKSNPIPSFGKLRTG